MLRSALGLSLATGIPFRMENIRAGRPRPGLRPQHQAAVEAAARVGRAEVAGNHPDSPAVEFRPRGVVFGRHRFKVGTAGSAPLVLQTVLPALLGARESSELVIEGGTHNPMAPPFDFLEKAFLPLVRRMGFHAEIRLEKHGFYPAGGGRLSARIDPSETPAPIEILERGSLLRRKGRILLSNLPLGIAERERRSAAGRLGWDPGLFEIEPVFDPAGPGNALLIEVESRALTEVFSAFGLKGVRSELVAAAAAEEVRRYLDSGVPVGERLADQLLIPMALAGGGAFRTLEPTAHARTCARVVGLFLPVEVEMRPEAGGAWRVEVRRK
jgi:RNA 3'-terminal phosphate cyclase (ATP)